MYIDCTHESGHCFVRNVMLWGLSKYIHTCTLACVHVCMYMAFFFLCSGSMKLHLWRVTIHCSRNWQLYVTLTVSDLLYLCRYVHTYVCVCVMMYYDQLCTCTYVCVWNDVLWPAVYMYIRVCVCNDVLWPAVYMYVCVCVMMYYDQLCTCTYVCVWRFTQSVVAAVIS